MPILTPKYDYNLIFLEFKLTADISYEESLYLALYLKESMNLTSEQAFYGLYKFCFPDSDSL